MGLKLEVKGKSQRQGRIKGMQRPSGWRGSRKEKSLDDLSGRRKQRGRGERCGVKLARQVAAAPGLKDCRKGFGIRCIDM